MPVLAAVRPPTRPLAELSPLAQAYARRTVAQIVIEANVGPAHVLRQRAACFRDAAPELIAAGHEPLGIVLEVYAEKALSNARAIEHLMRRPRPAPWLRLVPCAALGAPKATDGRDEQATP